MAAIKVWVTAADITTGPIFRRVIVRRYKARAARGRVDPGARGWNARWDPTWFTGRAAQDSWVEYDIGIAALHPGSVTPIFRQILRRAFAAGLFGDLSAEVFEEQVRQISAHSTRVGINQDDVMGWTASAPR